MTSFLSIIVRFFFRVGKRNFVSYAARIKEIADRIEDAHRLNNGGPLDNAFKRNLERDVIQCFIRRLRPELEICVEAEDTFKEVIDDIIDIERRLAANSALQRNRNTDYLKSEESTNNKNNKTTRFNVALENKIICLICKKPGHTTEKCFHLSNAQEAVLNNKIFCTPTNKDIIISKVKEVVIIILQETITIIVQIIIF